MCSPSPCLSDASGLYEPSDICDMALKIEKLTGSITGRPVLAMRLTVMWQRYVEYYGRNLPSGMM